MVKSKTLFRLANALTASRLLFAAGLIGLVYFRCTNTLVALILFVLGELTDAFDGVLARRATELAITGDQKRRALKLGKINEDRYVWVVLDQMADILLIGAMALYCFWYFQLGEIWILGGAALIMVALGIQVLRNTEMKRFGSLSEWTKNLVLARRYGYLGLVAAMIIAMIFTLQVPVTAKVILVIVGMAFGMLLAIYKYNRLTEDKTFVE